MRMLWLDFFRGAAAIAVVFYHLHDGFGLPAFNFGYLAVDLFFVLSGVVLGRSYESAIARGMPFVDFAWHRVRRLYPMLYISALFVLALNLAGIPSGRYAWSSSSMPAFLSMLALLPLPRGFGEYDAFPAASPTWSLFAEVASNFVWYVVLRFGGLRTAKWVFALSFMAAIGYAVHHGSLDFGVVGGVSNIALATLRALAWFGLGCWIARRKPAPMARPSIAVALFLTTLVIYGSGSIGTVLGALLVVGSGTEMLVSLMTIEPRNGTIRRLCAWFGMLSFPLYLTHVPAHRLALWTAGRGVDEAVAFCIVIPAVAVIATLLNESIVGRLPRDLRPRRPVAP
jgi:peptidoglycan/LPS O-acetylase OafA/YrhL